MNVTWQGLVLGAFFALSAALKARGGRRNFVSFLRPIVGARAPLLAAGVILAEVGVGGWVAFGGGPSSAYAVMLFVVAASGASLARLLLTRARVFECGCFGGSIPNYETLTPAEVYRQGIKDLMRIPSFVARNGLLMGIAATLVWGPGLWGVGMAPCVMGLAAAALGVLAERRRTRNPEMIYGRLAGARLAPVAPAGWLSYSSTIDPESRATSGTHASHV